MRAYFDEAPQAVKVFKRILSIMEDKNLKKVRTLRDTTDLYRGQGSLEALKNINEIVEGIKGK